MEKILGKTGLVTLIDKIKTYIQSYVESLTDKINENAQIVEDNELVTAQAINDLDNRIDNIQTEVQTNIQNSITELADTKVDKENGKVLIPSNLLSEINLVDSTVLISTDLNVAGQITDEDGNKLSNKVDKEDGKGLIATNVSSEMNVTSDGDFLISTNLNVAGLITDEDGNILSNKVDKVDGKQLSTNDYTTEEKEKLASTYTKSQVDSLLSQVGKLAYIVVTELPTASTSTTGYVYLIETSQSGVYDLYVTVVIDSSYEWRSLGTTSIDLTDYAKKADTVYLSLDEYDALVAAGTVLEFVEYNIYES